MRHIYMLIAATTLFHQGAWGTQDLTSLAEDRPTTGLQSELTSEIDSIEALWAGFDPRSDPLEIEVIETIEEDGIRMERLYFTGETWQGEKVRVYAIIGAPTSGENLPGILHIHGGGQTASLAWVRFWANRGYVCASHDYLGDWRAQDPNRNDFTIWHDVDGNMAQGAGNNYNMEPDARHNSWYHWTLVARRVLTLIENHPQVDPERLGVFGVSMGGLQTWLVAGSDDRIKVAVPIYSCGWTSYRIPPDVEEESPTEVEANIEQWRRLLAPQSYASRIQAPLLYMSASNDFHGLMDRTPQTLKRVGSKHVRQSFTPRYNHHIAPNHGQNLPLWMDYWLKEQGDPWPASPALDLQGRQGAPVAIVTPDRPDEIDTVRIYYALNNPWPQSRFWRDAVSLERDGNKWRAEIPFMNKGDRLYIFANVRYRSGVHLSSLLQTANAGDLTPSAPTVKWSSMIDPMTDANDWFYFAAYTDPNIDQEYFIPWTDSTGEKGFTLNRELIGAGEARFQIATHKPGDPQWRGTGRKTLLLDVYNPHQPRELRIKAIERHWQPTRHEFVTEFDSPSEDPSGWRTLRLDAAQFQDNEGQSMADWGAVDCLLIEGITSAEHSPVFRRLRWEMDSSEGKAPAPSP